MNMFPKHFESLYPVNTREKELSQLVGYIREGQSCQLIGLPGVGRTNLLGLLLYNKEVRLKHFPTKHGYVHFVLSNFSEVRNRPLLDVMKFLFLNLVTSLRERDMAEEHETVDRMFKESLSYNDELVMTQGLKTAIDYLALEKKLTIIFLFDRFEEYVPFVTSEFFTNLRAFRDRAKYRFSVIFSLARPLEETLEPLLVSDFSDFLTGHHIYLNLYDEPTISFRIAYLEKLTGKQLTQQEREALISMTGGHLRLTKLATEAYLAQQEAVEDIQQFVREQQTVQQALQSIWRSLTPSEQVYLLKQQEASGVPPHLQAVGLLKDSSIHIPLLQDFIASLPKDTQLLSYDEETNTIKKGEVTFSDSLTKAEFRLLRHLLQHREQVIDREEIVNVVWQETASTAGVTEQAVDQLIFRLRRKIEDDPNNPQHLITIKGRGVKFVL